MGSVSSLAYIVEPLTCAVNAANWIQQSVDNDAGVQEVPPSRLPESWSQCLEPAMDLLVRPVDSDLQS